MGVEMDFCNSPPINSLTKKLKELAAVCNATAVDKRLIPIGPVTRPPARSGRPGQTGQIGNIILRMGGLRGLDGLPGRSGGGRYNHGRGLPWRPARSRGAAGADNFEHVHNFLDNEGGSLRGLCRLCRLEGRPR